jgi:hypothetical protein
MLSRGKRGWEEQRKFPATIIPQLLRGKVLPRQGQQKIQEFFIPGG